MSGPDGSGNPYLDDPFAEDGPGNPYADDPFAEEDDPFAGASAPPQSPVAAVAQQAPASSSNGNPYLFADADDPMPDAGAAIGAARLPPDDHRSGAAAAPPFAGAPEADSNPYAFAAGADSLGADSLGADSLQQEKGDSLGADSLQQEKGDSFPMDSLGGSSLGVGGGGQQQQQQRYSLGGAGAVARAAVG